MVLPQAGQKVESGDTAAPHLVQKFDIGSTPWDEAGVAIARTDGSGERRCGESALPETQVPGPGEAARRLLVEVVRLLQGKAGSQ